MLLRFRPFKGRSYLHLQGQNLSLLTRVPESDNDRIEPPNHDNSDPLFDGLSEPPFKPSPASRLSRFQSTSLFDAIAGPLFKGLEAVHKAMEFAARSQLRRPSVDRCKLVVRLGKLLFGPPFGSPESLLPGLPPFTAGAFEAHRNRQGRRLPVNVTRSLETGMPETLFQAVESIVMAGEGASARRKETYYIRIVDTEQPVDTEYKLVCEPDTGGSGIILTKVKHNPLRYAVIDVSRPSRDIDFRLMLWTDTRLCSLDDATRSACERIASTAIIDGSSKGGLHWPITLDFDVGMPPSPSSPSSTTTHAPSPAPSPAPYRSPPSRFRVRSVRHERKLRVESGGLLWKLYRVNGVEYEHGGGRLTNEVDFCPLAWQEKMKNHQDPSTGSANSALSSEPTSTYSAASCFGSSLQQSAPHWTPEGILAECPALTHWMQQHLP
ncbi:hypothetical protein CLOM_g20682 [Closterium sp. NIES-68]|nr:hypothetical protein CLOM_g20682 [Closterium sp. NIES-68]GJP78407.1 hypothetical protein CLOP_g8707 [Closterium sp. NIES-67]